VTDLNDDLRFADESQPEEGRSNTPTWKVLIVDDEQDVHESTCLALGREKVCGRALNFVHAYSSEEAKTILREQTDFAVILLDVVMESEHAGLELVHFIRDDCAIRDSRIILRTGQPGYAPELETIAKYEINDYKSKSELTRNKLFTTLTAAIRSYSQIRALELSKKGLETIIRASKELLYLRGFSEFANGIITQLAGLLHLPEDGLVCVRKCRANPIERSDLKVIAAAGESLRYVMQPITSIDSEEVIELIYQAASSRENIFQNESTCLYFSSPNDSEMLVYLAAGIEAGPEAIQLLELFSTNIGACIDNLSLLEQRHKYAYRDQLLGIPNRLSFLQVVEQHLQQQTANLMAVLIDIDQFGALNDTIGTEKGDVLLKLVSDRLHHRYADHLVARISGDTFALLGDENVLAPDSVSKVFATPFICDGAMHTLSATQGRVQVGAQKASTDVIAQANVALKRAKQTLRGGYQDFHLDMLKETESRVHLLQNLRHAFDRDRLFMVYQPKIHTASGKVMGFEALMRWKTDTGAYIGPMEFIPIAESSGLIVPLGEWAMRAALVKMGQIRKSTGLDLSVAVNVSMVQFAHPDFLAMVDAALEFADADSSWLEIEITESFAMHDLKAVQTLITAIHDRGIRISIDDFGTGFSSLSYLASLDVHSLKIDKTFIDKINEQDIDTRIPETILRLGQLLKLDVVAEGVETEFQAQWLKENGCDYCQGYLFAKPIPRDEVEAWMQNHINSRTD